MWCVLTAVLVLGGGLDNHLRGRWVVPPLETQRGYLTPDERSVDLSKPPKRHPALFSKYAFLGQSGHQTGCGLPSFQEQTPPIIPFWDVPGEPLLRVPGVVRLVRALRGRSMCFMGDSLSLQFYHNIGNLAERTRERGPRVQVQSLPLVVVRPPLKPVDEAREAELKRLGYVRWWGSLRDVPSYKATELGSSHSSTFKWIKQYLWHPPDVELVEDCDVLVMNIAMHYSPSTKGFLGRDGRPYTEAVSGMLRWAANFSAAAPHKDRILVWKETTPQHFPTARGSFTEMMSRGCTALPNASDRQMHNLASDAAMRSIQWNGSCSPPSRALWVDAGHLVDSDVWRLWRTHNWTQHIRDEFQRDAARKHARLQAPLNIWPLWDLTKDHPEWHVNIKDCTHWCYSPTLFDAAIERLALILEEAKPVRAYQCSAHGAEGASPPPAATPAPPPAATPAPASPAGQMTVQQLSEELEKERALRVAVQVELKTLREKLAGLGAG